MNLTISHLFYVMICVFSSLSISILIITITKNKINNNLVKLNTHETFKTMNSAFLQLNKKSTQSNLPNQSIQLNKKVIKKEKYRPNIYPKSAIRNTTNINDLF